MSTSAQSVDLSHASKVPQLFPTPSPSPKYQGRIYTSFPKMSIGIILAALCLASELIGSEDITMLAGWAGSCYWLFCTYRIHKIISEYTLKAYPISARKAVGFQLIPFVQFYWSWRWTKALTRFIDIRTGKKKPKGRSWPGLMLIVTSVLGYYPAFKSIRLFFLFGLGLYLTGKLKKVLPPCQPLRCQFQRAEQWHLAMSTGVGAICTFLLFEAVLDLFHPDAHPKQELETVFFVSIAMLLFLEPVFERLRGVFGIAENSPAHPRKPWIWLAAFVILLFTNLFHGLLDSVISSAVNASWHSERESLITVTTFLIVSGGITYSWIAAAHRVPSRAAWSGLMWGLLATLMLAVLLPSDSSDSTIGLGSKAFAEAASQAKLANLGKDAAGYVTNEVNVEVQALSSMRLAWPFFGIAGGLVIDRKWGKHRAHMVAVSILSACLLYELLCFIPSWHQFHMTEDMAHQILSHVSVALGWALALIACASPRLLSPQGATETESWELRAKPRNSRRTLARFGARSTGLVAVPTRQSDVPQAE